MDQRSNNIRRNRSEKFKDILLNSIESCEILETLGGKKSIRGYHAIQGKLPFKHATSKKVAKFQDELKMLLKLLQGIL